MQVHINFLTQALAEIFFFFLEGFEFYMLVQIIDS